MAARDVETVMMYSDMLLGGFLCPKDVQALCQGWRVFAALFVRPFYVKWPRLRISVIRPGPARGSA